MSILNFWRPKQKPQAAVAPLIGIALQIEEPVGLRFRANPCSTVDELEIGAIGPGQLQCVFIASHRRATLGLSVDQARFLAKALTHWADSAEQISIN